MNIKGIFLFFLSFLMVISLVVFAKDKPKKIKPVPGKTDVKETGKERKSIKPAGQDTVEMTFDEFVKLIKDEAEKSLKGYKEVLKEEIKPKSEFETEEEYKKRLEGSSRELVKKKIQIIEDYYKKRKYYKVKEVSIELPKYNAEEQVFDIKIVTLPLIENVIYQPPEEDTNLKYVPSENGIDLFLKLKIKPEEAKKLREKDKFIKADMMFTIYLSLKNQDDLNVYSVVALGDLGVYIKDKDKTENVFNKSLRVNTPTFPKRD